MPRDERPKQACCLVSEVLEEAGLDRASVRRLRRQVLEGIILMCRWQLERMPGEPAVPRTRATRTRKIAVE